MIAFLDPGLPHANLTRDSGPLGGLLYLSLASGAGARSFSYTPGSIHTILHTTRTTVVRLWLDVRGAHQEVIVFAMAIQGKLSVVLAFVLTGLSTIVVCLRFYSRHFLVGKLSAADWVMSLALVRKHRFPQTIPVACSSISARSVGQCRCQLVQYTLPRLQWCTRTFLESYHPFSSDRIAGQR